MGTRRNSLSQTKLMKKITLFVWDLELERSLTPLLRESLQYHFISALHTPDLRPNQVSAPLAYRNFPVASIAPVFLGIMNWSRKLNS